MVLLVSLLCLATLPSGGKNKYSRYVRVGFVGRQPIFGRYGRAGGWAGGQVVGGGEEDYDHGDDYDYTLDMEKLEPRMVIAKKRMNNRVGFC